MACCPRLKKRMKDILNSNYCTFLMSLFATILSFADPITDILTLVEFYREDHKTWFAVGLAFVVLPCVPFLSLIWSHGSYKEICLCGFNPFSSAWVRLKICRTNFKKCCWDDNSNHDDTDLNDHSLLARLFEAVFESAPQFIIQLYAMSVQQEPVKIIQMISVPVSFLSLAWAFTAYDSDDVAICIFIGCNVKQKVILFVTYLFLLSSRLFAVTFFTITLKWWIISVLMIHNVLILIADTISLCRIKRVFRYCSTCGQDFRSLALRFCLHWLRDDMSPTIPIIDSVGEYDHINQRMSLLSNILFVVENCTMILIFYRFSPLSNIWYSLPVTVCVCSFSVIGAVARVAHRCFVTKESNGSNQSIAINSTVSTQPKQAGESTQGVSSFHMMAEYVSYV